MFDRFGADERAIEGLPIRLVIALVVGVASLSVMLNMVSGINGLSVSELDARPSPEVIGPGEQTVTFTVVDGDGRAVSDATVVVRGEGVALDGVKTATTGPDGEAAVTVSPELGANRVEGALVVEIKPPVGGGGYVDRRANARVLVVRR